MSSTIVAKSAIAFKFGPFPLWRFALSFESDLHDPGWACLRMTCASRLAGSLGSAIRTSPLWCPSASAERVVMVAGSRVGLGVCVTVI
jgi:hypothetical protein